MTANVDLYGKMFVSLFQGRINFITDPMYCMLVSSSYGPNQDSHQFVSDITGEVTASGYTAGGQQVTGISAAYEVIGSTKLLLITGGNLVWPTFTVDIGNPRYGVLYMAPSGIGPTQQPLVGYINFEGDEIPADEAFYINWNASGIFGISIPGAV